MDTPYGLVNPEVLYRRVRDLIVSERTPDEQNDARYLFLPNDIQISTYYTRVNHIDRMRFAQKDIPEEHTKLLKDDRAIISIEAVCPDALFLFDSSIFVARGLVGLLVAEAVDLSEKPLNGFRAIVLNFTSEQRAEQLQHRAKRLAEPLGHFIDGILQLEEK